MPLTPEEVIDALGLEPHPFEGGFFRETYRSSASMPGQERSLATAIYYLLTPNARSYLHRLPTDEVFHFYLGDPVEQLHLHSGGTAEVVVLGTDLKAGHRPQLLVPAGVWQGSILAEGGQLALLGTTMTPGFAYPDFEAGDRADLIEQYPAFAGMIERLTQR